VARIVKRRNFLSKNVKVRELRQSKRRREDNVKVNLKGRENYI
jgi:hypothetical protein